MVHTLVSKENELSAHGIEFYEWQLTTVMCEFCETIYLNSPIKEDWATKSRFSVEARPAALPLIIAEAEEATSLKPGL